MLKKILLLLSVLSFNNLLLNWFVNANDLKVKNTKITEDNNKIIIKEENNWQEKTITLTPEEIKDLEKQRWFLKLLESIYKKNQRIFIGIIMDKKLQEELYANLVTVNFSSRDFFINSTKNQFAFNTFLGKSEALDFLSKLKDWKPIVITINGSDKQIINTITAKDFLKDRKINYQYLFKLIKNSNWSYELKEIKINPWNNNDIFNIKTETKNYIVQKIKIVPGVLGYSSIRQIILMAIVIVIVIWTAVYWYIFNNIKKSGI